MAPSSVSDLPRTVKGRAFGAQGVGAEFEIELPVSYYVSPGARGRSGVILSAVDLTAGAAISVVEVSAL